MSVRIEGDIVVLEGDCGVEDAEPLASALEAGNERLVDISLCRQLHSAVVQALLAFQCRVEGVPTEGFVSRFVLPALAAARAAKVTPLPMTENSMERPE